MTALPLIGAFIFFTVPLLILVPQNIKLAEAKKDPSFPKNCYQQSTPTVMSTEQ